MAKKTLHKHLRERVQTANIMFSSRIGSSPDRPMRTSSPSPLLAPSTLLLDLPLCCCLKTN